MRTAAKQRELLKANAQGITGRPAVTDLLFKISPDIDNSGRGVLLVDSGCALNDPYYHGRAEKEQAERAKNGGQTDAEMKKARFYCAENEEIILASLGAIRIVVPAGHRAGEVRYGADGKAYTAVYELDDHGKPKGIAYYDDGFSCVRPDAAVLGPSIAAASTAGLTPSLQATVGVSQSITGLNAIASDVIAKNTPTFGSAADPLITTPINPSGSFGGPSGDPKQKPVPPALFFAANAPRFELH